MEIAPRISVDEKIRFGKPVISGTRVLRVVYEVMPDKIYVITVYPGRRSRYEKD